MARPAWPSVSRLTVGFARWCGQRRARRRGRAALQGFNDYVLADVGLLPREDRSPRDSTPTDPWSLITPPL